MRTSPEHFENDMIHDENYYNAAPRSEHGSTSASQATRGDASIRSLQSGDASQATGENIFVCCCRCLFQLFDQADDPNIGFGDLGRKLGEMWHALDENEKEDYRRRARWDQNEDEVENLD